MNLRVDLILPEEQRSANVINKKSAIRMGIVIIPAILLVIGSVITAKAIGVNKMFNLLESELDELAPKIAEADQVRKDLDANEDLLHELQGWRDSRILWNKQLDALQWEVADNVQFDYLSVKHETPLIDDKIPARSYSMLLEGKALGKRAEANIYKLKIRMEENPAFTSVVQNVHMEGRMSTEPGASQDDRVFKIDVTYEPQLMEPRDQKRRPQSGPSSMDTGIPQDSQALGL